MVWIHMKGLTFISGRSILKNPEQRNYSYRSSGSSCFFSSFDLLKHNLWYKDTTLSKDTLSKNTFTLLKSNSFVLCINDIQGLIISVELIRLHPLFYLFFNGLLSLHIYLRKTEITEFKEYYLIVLMINLIEHWQKGQ